MALSIEERIKEHVGTIETMLKAFEDDNKNFLNGGVLIGLNIALTSAKVFFKEELEQAKEVKNG